MSVWNRRPPSLLGSNGPTTRTAEVWGPLDPNKANNNDMERGRRGGPGGTEASWRWSQEERMLLERGRRGGGRRREESRREDEVGGPIEVEEEEDPPESSGGSGGGRRAAEPRMMDEGSKHALHEGFNHALKETT